MRALFTALCRLLLRIFFRRIRSVGEDRIPADEGTPVLYVLNHPNALLDPLFILCLSPRPVTFLAKAPLFSMILVKRFVRAFECLPVYRTQDGDDPSKNRASIEASITLLGSGKALALFPEGTSHSRPRLDPLKTGAARIALSASAATAERQPPPVQIVAVGLHYDDKTTFRSNALLVYGPPISTPVVELDDQARPPLAAAEELTARMSEALAEVTIQAQTHEIVNLARSAATIFAAAETETETETETGSEPTTDSDPRAAFDLERRLVAGHEQLRARDPARLAQIVARVRGFETQLADIGLPLDHPARLERGQALRWTWVRLASLAVLAAPALVGAVIHLLPYRAIDHVAHRMAGKSTDGGEDVLATIKLIAGFLFIPLTWVALALAGGLLAPPGWRLGLGLGLLVLAPPCGLAALRFVELLADTRERARGAWALVSRRELGPFLAQERAAIRAELVALAESLGAPTEP